VFEIAPTQPYPEDYDECLDVAIAERDAGARPAYSGDVDLAPYKTVYLGYPLWWRDLPMCVYTFLESHDWAGKEVRPFCTHGGMGIMGTVESVAAVCAGAKVGEALSMDGATAQYDRATAESAVDSWLG
jgi:flavodoxin